MNLLNILNQYLNNKQEILKYFNYKDEYKDCVIADNTQYYWVTDNANIVAYHEDEQNLKDFTEDYYYGDIIEEGIYRSKDFTLIKIGVCGTLYLSIFDNNKECSEIFNRKK